VLFVFVEYCDGYVVCVCYYEVDFGLVVVVVGVWVE